jgi:hypothetical protein
MNALFFSEYLAGGEELTARASRAQGSIRVLVADDHAILRKVIRALRISDCRPVGSPATLPPGSDNPRSVLVL